MPLPEPEPRFRLFLAIAMPEEVRTELHKAQAELRRILVKSRVSWTQREQFHLTLKFLGDVDAQRLEPLAEAVRRACQGFHALRLRSDGVGCFPDWRRPRVIWAGVRDEAQELLRLQQAIEDATGMFTAEAREERFSGHVTLGRIKLAHHRESEALGRHSQQLAERSFGQWTAPTIGILRSELSPQGAIHTVMAEIAL